ncbi:DUF1214 domain-containing protein [Hephaestia sp. GCM10023244]|uniref:DUF1214 domain-containing protein n=1 Tax=unclassified Hephaestia TaxID=2631281 RepID=UPI0020774E66|nr:DUF1214 domain-containing protein [Hephaestia sp. MAHUQ-44]MCM8732493.1 DUF1214 domain-containing protein [Hephaestia sp. MAHUQ-44]
MRRALFAWGAAGVLALAAGAGTAWVQTGRSTNLDGRGPGPWKTSSGTGEASDSAFDRAVIARTGIWALPQSEVVYFTADTDDDGRPLDARCSYELKRRGELKARWWSIAAYVDYRWVDNPLDRYSYSSTNLERESGGDYVVRLSATPQPGNWLPLGDKPGRVSVLTRLFQPDPAIAAAPEKVPLPTIRRVACA